MLSLAKAEFDMDGDIKYKPSPLACYTKQTEAAVRRVDWNFCVAHSCQRHPVAQVVSCTDHVGKVPCSSLPSVRFFHVEKDVLRYFPRGEGTA